MNKKTKKRKKSRIKAGLTLKGKIIIFFTLFIILLIIAIVLMLTLEFFNLKQVNVNELVKIEKEEILIKSDFILEKNIFLQNYLKAKREIRDIKAVKNVSITLKLPNQINIDIEERQEIYQIESEKKYYIIDEQGYLIKIVEERNNNLPRIIGIQAGFEDEIRLDISELVKLENINKIYNTSKMLNMDGLVTDITLNTIGFTINFQSNKKKAHFNDFNNLMNSMQLVREILCSEEEQNKKGDIYITEKGARFQSK